MRRLRLPTRTYIVTLVVMCAAVGALLYVTHRHAQPTTRPSSPTSHAPTTATTPAGLAKRTQAAPALLASYTPPFANGLVTNEFAYWNPHDPLAKKSPDWQMTSGSLFVKNGVFWTGVPDACFNDQASPNPHSGNCMDSDVFRLNTARKFSGSIGVSLKLQQQNEIHKAGCNKGDTCWYGTHIWLRYQNEFNLYYVSVNRADGDVVIKRKVPCGSDNSGTYFVLGDYVKHDFRTDSWNTYTATVQTNHDGSVTIKLYDDSYSTTKPIDVGTDRGGTNPNWSASCKTHEHYASAAYQPITAAGAVGVRGDYANFEFTNFKVYALVPVASLYLRLAYKHV